MRSFVVIGLDATDDFSIDDLPGTSGRLDVGLRCVRAALLVSHGVRRDAVVYLILCAASLGGRILRIRGSDVRFIRPDERSLAVLAQKALAAPRGEGTDGFVPIRAGVAVATGGLERVLTDLGDVVSYVLEEDAPDIRGVSGLGSTDCAFFVGGPTGYGEVARARLAAMGAQAVGVGPISVHAEDAIAIVSNEIDRRRGGTHEEDPRAGL
jgi:tRNA (pseudouridine54-N1)-methyltransferase